VGPDRGDPGDHRNDVLVTTHLSKRRPALRRVALMHRGRIRALGTPAELRAHSARTPPWTTCSGPTRGPPRRARRNHARRRSTGAPREGVMSTPTLPGADPGRPGPLASCAPRSPDQRMCLVELQKLRHDRNRAGHQGGAADALAAGVRDRCSPESTPSPRRHAVPGLPGPRDPGPVRAVHCDLLRHPDHLERDSGVLSKLMVTPTPRVG